MLTILDRAGRMCEAVSRRQLLQAGGAGLLGLSLPRVLAAGNNLPAHRGRARSVIFLFLFGGTSRLETFTMKPGAACSSRGPFQPIASRTPGLMICEHLPNLARMSDKFCVLRTLTHSFNDHSGGGHYIQTGKRWHIPIGGGFDATPSDWPSMGSVVEFLNQRQHGPGSLPRYAVVPNYLGRLEQAGQYRRPGEYAGWLGRAYNPLTTTVNKRNLQDNPYWRPCSDEELTFQIEGSAPPSEVTLDRVRNRQSLLEQFDAQRRLLDGMRRP